MGCVLDNAKPDGTSVVGKCPNCGVKLKLNFLILIFIIVFGIVSLMQLNEIMPSFSFYTKVGLLVLWSVTILLLSRYFIFSIYKRS